jgi:hypothetical protein
MHVGGWFNEPTIPDGIPASRASNQLQIRAQDEELGLPSHPPALPPVVANLVGSTRPPTTEARSVRTKSTADLASSSMEYTSAWGARQ